MLLAPRVARSAFFVALASLSSVAMSSLAFAADASPWNEGLQSAARLIAARAAGTGAGLVYRSGLEVRLSPGWKTYWRHPGDSGVPPSFDFLIGRIC